MALMLSLTRVHQNLQSKTTHPQAFSEKRRRDLEHMKAAQKLYQSCGAQLEDVCLGTPGLISSEVEVFVCQEVKDCRVHEIPGSEAIISSLLGR